MEDTRWTVRVTASALEGEHAIAYARKHSFVGGAPLSFDVEHRNITALEYLLGAVALDIAGGIRTIAKKRRTDIDAVEVLVHGKLHNPMVFLRVVGETGDPGISVIEARVYISSFDDEEAVKKVWTEMLEVSPVLGTLRKAVELRLTYQQVL